MGDIIFLSACAEAVIVVLSIFLGKNVDVTFYVTTFLQFFGVTWLTLFGLNKVRRGTTFFRTLFCLGEMYILLLLSYAVFKAGITKLDLSILNPTWDQLKANVLIVLVGQLICFIQCLGWGLTEVDVDVFKVI